MSGLPTRNLMWWEWVVTILSLLFAAWLIFSASDAQGAPPMNLPAGVTVTPETVNLGKMLFFDRRLSQPQGIACATCHQGTKGSTDQKQVSEGIFSRVGNRNAPTIINAMYRKVVFLDGRSTRLEQTIGPIGNRLEMGNQNLQTFINRVASLPGYRAAFAKAFGRVPNIVDYSRALVAFQSTLTSDFNSPLDNYVREVGQFGNSAAMSPAEIRGFDVFKASSCIECHAFPMMTDFKFANTGISFRFRDGDQGRQGIDQNATPRSFAVPSLREVNRTFPYMHNGRLNTLRDVVDHYDAGAFSNGFRDRFVDPRIRPLGLGEQQKQDLVSFLSGAMESKNFPIIQPPIYE